MSLVTNYSSISEDFFVQCWCSVHLISIVIYSWSPSTEESRGESMHSKIFLDRWTYISQDKCHVKANGSGTLCTLYVGFTPMCERPIYGFRAGRRGCAASLLCRHINVIKNSDFFVVYSKFGIWTTSVFGGSIMWIGSYICYLFNGWALTFIDASRPPATVTNPHIVRSLGSKETHIQANTERYEKTDRQTERKKEKDR